MKRMIGTGLFALLLATMVVPSAQAIRPELLPERVHPTIHTDVMSEQGATVQNSTMIKDQPKVQASMPTEKVKQPEAEQASENERPSFLYFQEIYRQRYGN